MRVSAVLCAVLLAWGAANVQCAGRESGRAVNPEDSGVTEARAAEASRAGNALAMDLYEHLRQGPGNVFFSPYSISAALAMTYGGARGGTEEEMARVLHVPAGADWWHEAVGALRGSLDSESADYDLSVANRLWGNKGFEFLEPFLRVTRDRYGAELQELDFSGSPEQARVTINGWVAEKTQDKIPDLLAPGTVQSATRLVLTNAIYFKGTWVAQFDPELTRDAPFHVDAATSVTVPMMNRKASFGFAELEGLKVLDMPYAGERLSMLVLLPHDIDGLPELEGQLSWKDLEAWISAAHVRTVQVSLPRFTMRFKAELSSVLSDMGMASAFDPQLADFSGMTGKKDLFISFVVHEAYVDVNEEGTEAAAATATGLLTASAAPRPTFIADHPFLFFIRDRVTGAILFMGRVANPSA